MLLPFLKNKLPRQAPEATSEQLVNGSASDHVDSQMMDELMEAVSQRNASQFRNALEALVMNLFDWEGDDD